MSSKVTTLIWAFMVTLTLYNTLLIGGGRGPFSLYNDHWACHCDELSLSVEEEKAILNGPARPLDKNKLFIVIDGQTVPAHSVVWLFGNGTDDANNVCKRKAPLKYLSIIAANIMCNADTQVYTLPYRHYIQQQVSIDLIPILASGHQYIAIKPPAA